MARKTGLADAFAQTKTDVPTPPPQPAADDSHRAPSRRGRRAVTFYLSPEAHMQLRTIALERGGSTQALLVEKVNDLFAEHGKARIA